MADCEIVTVNRVQQQDSTSSSSTKPIAIPTCAMSGKNSNPVLENFENKQMHLNCKNINPHIGDLSLLDRTNKLTTATTRPTRPPTCMDCHCDLHISSSVQSAVPCLVNGCNDTRDTSNAEMQNLCSYEGHLKTKIAYHANDIDSHVDIDASKNPKKYLNTDLNSGGKPVCIVGKQNDMAGAECYLQSTICTKNFSSDVNERPLLQCDKSFPSVCEANDNMGDESTQELSKVIAALDTSTLDAERPAAAYKQASGNAEKEDYKLVQNMNKEMLQLQALESVAQAMGKCDTNEYQTVSKISYTRYENELQMPDIMRLITRDLSEPYSIYTYRYFIHNWPKLCFLVSFF